MTIPNLPLLDPYSPTFRNDVDAFFGGQIQTTINAINPEIERINQIGAGSFAATSGDTLTISLGTVSLAIESGKGFSPGQPVMIARTAAPGDYMAGQVLSYDRSTGAMQVDVTLINGTGAHTGWSVSIVSILSALQLDSIIVLTSGTTWTVPDGVRKVKGYVEGGCSGGPGSTATSSFTGASTGGGGLIFVAIVNPGETLTYSIGAGGGPQPANANNPGLPGGDTYITIGGVEYRATGGPGVPSTNNAINFTLGGDGVQVANSWAVKGGNNNQSGSTEPTIRGGRSAFGFGHGGRSGTSTQASTAGDPGRIVLELYK